MTHRVRQLSTSTAPFFGKMRDLLHVRLEISLQ